MSEGSGGTERNGGAERPPESGGAAPGRGGRMSRQRKTAVLQLLRGEDGDDERFGVGADRSPPAAEAVGGPLGVAPVSAGHVLGIGAMPTTAVAPLMRGHARAAVEDLERSLGEARVDLRPDQDVRHRVVKAVDLDM